MEKVKIEKFTLAKYKRYKKNGIDFHIYSEQGKEWEVIDTKPGVLNGETMLQGIPHDPTDLPKHFSYAKVDSKGKDYWNGQFYIMTGIGDIQSGDLIISKSSPDNTFFFYEKYNGFCEEGGDVGYVTHWSCDSEGEQVDICHTFNACSGYLQHDAYIRKATAEEEEQFYKYLLAAGYGYDEERGCLYDVPTIGKEYWTLEFNKQGLVQPVHHDAIKTEEERPFDRRNVYIELADAICIAEHINDYIMASR